MIKKFSSNNSSDCYPKPIGKIMRWSVIHFPSTCFSLVLILSICIPFQFKAQNKSKAATSREVLTQMFKAINEVKTLKYDLKISERIKGDLKIYGSSIKLQRTPRKLYVKIKNVEILWLEGTNKGQALVNPGAFPYVNLNLDPLGSLMNEDQHHTIHEIGFDYLKSILEHGVTTAGDKFEKIFLMNGLDKANGRDCYKISIVNNFSFSNYTVKKNETLITIARKLYLSEYMILENNPTLKNYESVKEGTIIKVPSAYSKMTVIYIDKQTNLPLITRVYDDKGLFESYEYLNLQLNPVIKDEEFSRKYKEYHF